MQKATQFLGFSLLRFSLFQFFPLLFILLVCRPLWAQEPLYTPKPSSAERSAILDSLRAAVQKELKKPVTFKVEQLKVQGSWAFMHGVPLQPNGKRMNYRDTPYQEAIEQGMFDDWICALLQKRQGRWRTVTYSLGATDVPYLDWSRKYQAPSALFR
ncbi:MAG: hypothetical protein U1F76_32155 [Candidatus Competibacteraceae bacterium]